MVAEAVPDSIRQALTVPVAGAEVHLTQIAPIVRMSSILKVIIVV